MEEYDQNVLYEKFNKTQFHKVLCNIQVFIVAQGGKLKLPFFDDRWLDKYGWNIRGLISQLRIITLPF